MPQGTPSPPPSAEAELDRRSWAVLAALVAIYAGVIVGLAATGRFTFVWKTSVVPALFVVALARRRLGLFLRDWAVFLGLVILFDSLRGIVFAGVTSWVRPLFAGYALELERNLLGGTTFPQALQSALGAGPPGALAKALVLVHGSHFVVFLLFGLTVWLLRRDAFSRYTGATLLLIGVGLLLYAAIPTVPPWMAAERFHLLGPIRHYSAEIYNLASPDLGRTFDVNPVAAMPSLHTALPALFAAIAVHHFGWRGLPVLVYALAVVFAVGYLGEHYLVDVLAGVGLSLLIYAIVYRSRFWRVRPAPAEVGRRVLLQRGLLALTLVIASELVGQATMALRRPLMVDEAFVESELEGKSDLASVFAGQLAFARGDLEGAKRQFSRAVGDVRDDEVRRDAISNLYVLGQLSGTPPRLTRRLEDLGPARRGARGSVLLAWSRIEDGDRAGGLRELDGLAAAAPDDPEPVYLGAWLRARAGELEPAAAQTAVSRLRALAARGVPGAAERAAALSEIAGSLPGSSR